MDSIVFDCKNCGATLEIPENAVGVICKYCKSQFKVAYHDGVVTADLIKKVAIHEKRIGKLEKSDEFTRDAISAIAELPDLEKQIKDFEVRYPKVTSGRKSTGLAFAIPTFLNLGFVILLAFTMGFSDQAHHGGEWSLQNIEKNLMRIGYGISLLGLLSAPGLILGFLYSCSASVHNSHYDDYEKLLFKRKQLKEKIQCRTCLTGDDPEK